MTLFFSEWIALTPEAVESSLSDVPGLYEVKIDRKLVDYPMGRSAMVYYGRTTKEQLGLRTLVLADWFSEAKVGVRRQWEGVGPLVFRWAGAGDVDTEHARRIRLFVERFGRTPWAIPDPPTS